MAASRQAQASSPGSRHVENFLEMLAAERGAAANTLQAYARDLDDFASFLARRGRPVQGARVTDIRAYLGHLADAGLVPRSAARRLSALRQFHRFLFGQMRRDWYRSDRPGSQGPIGPMCDRWLKACVGLWERQKRQVA